MVGFFDSGQGLTGDEAVRSQKSAVRHVGKEPHYRRQQVGVLASATVGRLAINDARGWRASAYLQSLGNS